MALIFLFIFPSAVMCHLLDHSTFQPYGPQMCKLICKTMGRIATTFDEVHLFCNIIPSTESFDCNIFEKQEEDASVLSSIKCTPKGKKITKSSPTGRLPHAADMKRFQKACKEGNLIAVKRMVCQGLVDINFRWRNGYTPVMVASRNNQTKIFDFLVQRGCYLSRRDDKSFSVLHHACYGGAYDIVRKLLDKHHSDIESRDKYYKTPLMYAVQLCHGPVVKLLKCKGADMNAEAGCNYNILHFAIMGGNVEMVKYVLSLTGFDIESKECYGRTPLNLAVHHGHLKVVEFLITHKADITRVDNSDFNVLHTACKAGELGIVKYLITFEELRGFERSETNQNMKPIDLARNSNIVKFLQTQSRLQAMKV